MELNELRKIADIRSDLVEDGVLMYDEASEVLTRLEQAERAVQRVRELNQFLPASIMERITRALDDDTRG